MGKLKRSLDRYLTQPPPDPEEEFADLEYLFKLFTSHADEPNSDSRELLTYSQLIKRWPAIEKMLPKPHPQEEIWELTVLHDLTFIKVQIAGLVTRD